MNIILIFVNSVLNMILGFVWYGVLFDKEWMKLSKMTDQDIKNTSSREMTINYATSYISGLFLAAANYVIYADLQTTKTDKLLTSLAVVTIFILASSYPSHIFTKKPLKLWLIDYLYPVTFSILSILVYSYFLG